MVSLAVSSVIVKSDKPRPSHPIVCPGSPFDLGEIDHVEQREFDWKAEAGGEWKADSLDWRNIRIKVLYQKDVSDGVKRIVNEAADFDKTLLKIVPVKEMDTVCDLGGATELANYGEYSGDPSETQTYEYAKTLLDLMTDGAPHPQGKVLIIGGSIDSFTNVAKTFKGIVRALEEYKLKLQEHNVTIFVRRGGPNYQEGLRKMKEVGSSLGVPMHVYGPETHMTAVVGAALGKKPLPDAPAPPATTGQFLLPGSYNAIVWGQQQKAIQGMLDFDFVCGRAKPSVVAATYPLGGDHKLKFYFGHKEILIPVYSVAYVSRSG